LSSAASDAAMQGFGTFGLGNGYGVIGASTINNQYLQHGWCSVNCKKIQQPADVFGFIEGWDDDGNAHTLLYGFNYWFGFVEYFNNK